MAIALENNPDLIAAREQAKAAEYDVDVAGAGRLPKVSLYSQWGYNDYFGSLGGGVSPNLAQSDKSAQVGAQLPYRCSRAGARRPARRAQALASAALESEIAAERDVIAQSRAAYSA